MIQRAHAALLFAAISISFFTSMASAENEQQIVREPAQKKSVPASGESTWGSSSTNGDFVNLRAAPLGLLIGYINLDLEFKLSDQWSIGPTISYWKFDYDSSYYVSGKLAAVRKAAGVRANWSQNGTYRTGMYLSPMLQFVTATVEGVSVSTGRTVTGEGRAPLITGLVGYHWFGDGGWNASVGAGLTVGGAKAEVTDGVSTVNVESSRTGSLALDFMLGYVF